MQVTRNCVDGFELNMWGPCCIYKPGVAMRLGRVRAMSYGSGSNSWTCMIKWYEAPIRSLDYSRVDLVVGPYAERCLHVCGVIISWSVRGTAYCSCCAIRHRLQLERAPCQSADAWSDDCKKRLKSLFRLAISGEERILVLTEYCRLSRRGEAEKETGRVWSRNAGCLSG